MHCRMLGSEDRVKEALAIPGEQLFVDDLT
jgi:hypothetical protein